MNTYKNSSVSGNMAILALVCISSIILLCVVYSTQFGLDITDESFYLNWIESPFSYPISVTQFGYIYHGIKILLNLDIVGLRLINIASALLLAYVMILKIFQAFQVPTQLNKVQIHVLAMSFALPSLFILTVGGHWLSTPSYNSLTLCSLIIIVIGILFIGENSKKGWVILGIGYWLLFMSKPTSAILVIPLVLMYLWAIKSLLSTRVLITVVTFFALIVISALVIDGSLSSFYTRLMSGLALINIQGSGHSFAESFFRLISFPTGARAKAAIAIIVTIATFTFFIKEKYGFILFASVQILPVIGSLMAISLDFGQNYSVESLIQIMLPLSFFASCVLLLITDKAKLFYTINKKEWSLIAILLLMPYVYAFGTNNDILSQASSAGIFWVVSGLLILCMAIRTHPFSLIVLATFSVQLMVFIVLWLSMESPYRNSLPFRKMERLVEVRDGGTKIFLDDEVAIYISQVKDIANIGEFREGDVLIDLTGDSPGVIYAIAAQGAGSPWLIGGYPGSNFVAVETLRHISCEKLAQAWVFFSEDGPHRISKELLNTFGAHLEVDYLFVGEVKKKHMSAIDMSIETQMLYKPIRSVNLAVQKCKQSRL